MIKAFSSISLALLLLGLGAAPAMADILVLSNRASVAVTFRRLAAKSIDGALPSAEQKIDSGDFATIHCRGPIRISYSDGRNPVVHALDANCAYRFVEDAARKISLEKIFLEGDARTLRGTGIAVDEAEPRPTTLPVKIYVDDNQRSATALWQRQLTRRLEQASDIFEKHCLLRFRLVGFGEWNSDEKINDFAVSLAEFEREVPAVPGGFVIGFTCQYSISKGANKLGGTRGPLHPHILISEQSTVISEGERLEVLVHELGHCLGAAHSIDPHSVMRPLLGDRLARAADFRIEFDPENTVALNLLSDELRVRNASRRVQLLPATGLRLTQIHQELERRLNMQRVEELARRQKQNPAKKPPAKQIAKNKPPTVVAAAEQGQKEAKAPFFNLMLNKDLQNPALRTGTQSVLADVIAAAEVNAALALPAAETDADPFEGVLFGELAKTAVSESSQSGSLQLAMAPEAQRPRTRLTGDRLTAYYVRVAAAAAGRLPEEHANSAFLLALGIAVDSSDILHRVPQTGEFCRAVEPPDQRSRRLKSLGHPTIHGRRDLAQHFVVSAHLTVALGRTTAEAAGMAKEIVDAERGSGFSFADLAANKAGIRLATQLERNAITLEKVARSFLVKDYVPAVDGLPEELGSERFKTEYGNGANEKFAQMLAEIHSRLSRLPAYQ